MLGAPIGGLVASLGEVNDRGVLLFIRRLEAVLEGIGKGPVLGSFWSHLVALGTRRKRRLNSTG